MPSQLAPDRFRVCREDNPRPTYGVPRSLNLNKKVFLSHSSAEKDFVWSLHEQLCNCYHDAIAFFDVVTLSKAKPVSMENILEEAKGSKLGILVLSEHFFMQTQNPMLELVEFVSKEVKLLPLFFKLSFAQFKEKDRRATWETQWEKWAAGDKGVVEKWKKALDVVNTFNGIEFNKATKPQTETEYIHEIVKAVTCIIPPAISFSKEGVYGKDRLCKLVEDMYERCGLNHKCNDRGRIAFTSTSFDVSEDGRYGVEVVGVYGFAGLGKTTLCNSLCDHYFEKFNGRVCHIDLGSRPLDKDSFQSHSNEPYIQRMKYILAMLTDYTNNGRWQKTNTQVENMLILQISLMRDPVFLAIDNVSGEDESQVEAEFYLKLSFPKGSKIFLTTRSYDILKNLANQFRRFSMDFGVLNVQDEVNGLVKMCRIVQDSVRYHPFMLKSLAASIKWNRARNPDWKERFAELRREGIIDKNGAWKSVFKVLDISYASLGERAKTLFLDLLLFYSATREPSQIRDWVKSIYSHLDETELAEIFLQLEDLFFVMEGSQPPNLLVDFAIHKVSEIKGTGINQHYLVVDGKSCPGVILGHVKYLSISRCAKASILDLRNVQGLEVLHLVDNAGLQEVRLSRTSCASLQSVIVRVPPGSLLDMTMDEDLSVSAANQKSSTAVGLRWAQLAGNVIYHTLRRSSLWKCNVLSPLLRCFELTAAPVLDLGCLGNLLNLADLRLRGLPSVQAIDLTTCARLKTFQIFDCEALLALTIPNSSELHSKIDRCASLERVSLCTTSSYAEVGCSSRGSVDISFCPTLGKIDGLVQYAGDVDCLTMELGAATASLEETFGDWLKFVGINTSICKGKVDSLCLSGASLGLAGVRSIAVDDAQHIWLLLSRLFEAQPECHLEALRIHCKKGGDCGCDRILPSFVSLPPASKEPWSMLVYWCPKVRDLSSVARWDVLRELDLKGCRSVEVLPDFSTLTSLHTLNLSGCRSVKVVPDFATMNSLRSLDLSGCTSVEVLPDFSTMTSLESLDLKGCTSLAVLPDFSTMTSLESLDLKGCTSLAVLPDLATMTSLQFLNLSGCTSLGVMPELATLTSLRNLNLSGCTSLAVLPDFATMTSLITLNVSYTSLKEWPAGVLCLPRLQTLDLRGCRQLAAKELIKVIALEQDFELSTCAEYALGALMFDLGSGKWDRWSVMDALDSHFHELCQLGSFDSWHCSIQVAAWILMLLYDFWFNEGYGAGICCEGGPPSKEAVQKMRRLLCSAFVMQWFPSYLRSRAVKGSKDPYMAFALMGIAVVGAASIGWYKAAMNECLKDSIMNFLNSCSSSTALKQDHLYFQVRRFRSQWEISCFRPLCEYPELLSTRVPKLQERVGEGVGKMMAMAGEVGPDFMMQGLEATQLIIVSRNLLQYDVRWLFSSYMGRVWIRRTNRADWGPALRAYYNLLGERDCQRIYNESTLHILKWQDAVVNF